MDDRWIDQIIGGYRLVRRLGSGGMGEVYEAETFDGRRVTVKIYAVKRKDDHFLRQRFISEGRILSRLSHPNLVRVYDMGVDSVTDTPWMAMDLVLDSLGCSKTLADVQKMSEVTEGNAERWYGQLVSALDYCHSHGIVHRDVKLNNVLIDPDGNAILSDFGVARILDDEMRDELQQTTTMIDGMSTGTRPVMGTYWYLAPELRRGEVATAASDWYAMGVAFFRLLTGMWYEPGTNALDLLSPFDGRWRARLEKLLSNNPAERKPMRGPICRREGNHRVKAGVWLLAVAFLIIALGACFLPWWANRAASEASSSRDSRIVLSVDATNRFVFCSCPPGTNSYRTISIAVSHSYWLAATPVTRRQWFAVRGEPLTAWKGGEDAPMTYVSRDEVTDFCARLNARFAAQLPLGYEIRLPTLAEWRLAYAEGRTVPENFPDKKAMRIAYAERGWFGQGVNGMDTTAGMRSYYEGYNLPVPLVTNIWRTFPPKIVRPGKDEWERSSSQIPPVPVGLKPANDLGLYDMLGNCFERMEDTCSDGLHSWGKTEWGVTVNRLYQGQGLSITNPVERTGTYPLMVGGYMAPDIPGDRAWSSLSDRMPHLGFRLCIGPKFSPNP